MNGGCDLTPGQPGEEEDRADYFQARRVVAECFLLEVAVCSRGNLEN